MPSERETTATGAGQRRARAPRRGCAWALLVVIAGASLFALLGYLSNGLSESRAVAKSRSHLADWFREANPARPPEDACWVEPEALVRRELTPSLGSGPNWRPQSRLERLLFKPGFVFRSDAPPCGRSQGAAPWAYAGGGSRIPFIVRVHYGYFDTTPGDPAGMTYEGVTTYFSFFGRAVPLNDWSVRPESR